MLWLGFKSDNHHLANLLEPTINQQVDMFAIMLPNVDKSKDLSFWLMIQFHS